MQPFRCDSAEPTPSAVNRLALVWSIFGETGEIRLTSAVDNMLQISRLEGVSIEVDDFRTGEV